MFNHNSPYIHASLLSTLSTYKGLVPKNSRLVLWSQLLPWDLIEVSKRASSRGNAAGRGTLVSTQQLQAIHRHSFSFPWAQPAPHLLCSSSLQCHELLNRQWFAGVPSQPAASFDFPEPSWTRSSPSHFLTSTTLCFPAAEASFDLFPRGRTWSWSNTISTAHSALLTQRSRGERDFPSFPLPKLSSAFCYIKGEAN